MQPKKKTQQATDKTYVAYSVEERRAYIADKAENYGISSLRPTQLAKQFGKNRSTIYDDIAWVKTHINVIDGEAFMFEMFRGIKKVYSVAMEVLNDPKASRTDKARHGTLLMQVCHEGNQFLETHGMLQGKKPVKTESFEEFIIGYGDAPEEEE